MTYMDTDLVHVFHEVGVESQSWRAIAEVYQAQRMRPLAAL
jgi:hypothetical protein